MLQKNKRVSRDLAEMNMAKVFFSKAHGKNFGSEKKLLEPLTKQTVSSFTVDRRQNLTML